MTKQKRQRYIGFQILCEPKAYFEKGAIINCFWTELVQLFGTYHSFQSGLWLVDFDPHSKVGILRCDHTVKDLILATLTLITEIHNHRVIVHTVKTAGTLRKLKEVLKTRMGIEFKEQK